MGNRRQSGAAQTALLVVAFNLEALELFDKSGALHIQKPGSAHLVAAGFVAASYVTLTFYDYFSLRAVGRREYAPSLRPD